MSTQFTNACTRCLNTTFSKANDSFGALVKEGAEMPPGEILKLSLQLLIALFGVVGNILVTIVIISMGNKKHKGDFYLQNLAIADLVTLLLGFPLVVIREKAPWNWPLGKFACLYLYPFPEIFYGASVWCIVVIAIERYHKIVTMKSPGRHSKKAPSRRANTVAACVWVLSFLFFCLPLYFVVEYLNGPNGGKFCGPIWPPLFFGVYVCLLTLFSYILPLTVISFTYIAISRKIKESNIFIKAIKQAREDLVDGQQSSSLSIVKSARLKQNRRAKKILTPIVLVFAVTMLPLNILRLTLLFLPTIGEKEYVYQTVLYVMILCTLLNPSANPVIYSAVSKDFRKGVNSLCCRQRGKAHSLNLSGMLRLRSRSTTINHH